MPSCWMIGAGHVSFPFKFPGLYGGNDWLQHVKEEHKYDQFEIRDPETGSLESTYRVTPKILHPNRDLVIASFDRLSDIKEILRHTEGNTFLEPATEEMKIEQEVVFAGFVVENSGMENERHIPRLVPGKINLISQVRAFAAPEVPLEMGLCGGPVLNKEGQCIGILEGTINPPNDNQSKDMQQFSQAFQGSALFVPVQEAIRIIENTSFK